MNLSSELENIELRKEIEKLRSLLDYDELCQIYNKRSTQERVGKVLSKNGEGVLLVIDIDRFKFINDYFGHLIGDDALRKFSKAIRLAVNKDDAIIGRIGGDEFIVFIKETLEQNLIDKTIRNIKNNIQKIQLLNSDSPSISASVYETLFDKADQKLIEYKSSRQDLVKDFRQLNTLLESNYYDFENFCFSKRKCTNENNHLLIITMLQKNDIDIRIEQNNGMLRLYESISGNLREGDFFTQYSNNQYLILCKYIEGNKLYLIKDRINEEFKETTENQFKLKVAKFGIKRGSV